MYISYSGYTTYLKCPFKFWHLYINNTPYSTLDDRLSSIYGTVVGRLFEDFYAQKWWSKKENCQPYMQSVVEEYVSGALEKAIQPHYDRPGGVILWGDKNPKAMYASRADLVSDVRDTIPRGIQSIKCHKLLGPVVRTEFKLNANIGTHVIGGKADFIVERMPPYSDVIILDGKGSRHRGKYLNPDQLWWYAMLYRIRFDKLPDKLGFLHWRCESDESMDLVDFSSDDLDMLLSKVLKTIDHIEKASKKIPASQDFLTLKGVAQEVFKPVYDSFNCKFCPFCHKMTCPVGYR